MRKLFRKIPKKKIPINSRLKYNQVMGHISQKLLSGKKLEMSKGSVGSDRTK